MKEQKSVRAKEYGSRYVKIYVAAAILCLLVAVAVSFTVLKLTNPPAPLPPVTQGEPTSTTNPTATENNGVTPSQTPTPTPTPTPSIDPSKIDTVTMTEAQSKYGSLVLVNPTYTFNPATAASDLVVIREHPDRTITVTAWQDKVTYSTFKALCDMQTAMESEIDSKNMQFMTTEPYSNADETSEHGTGLGVNLKFQERTGTGYTFSHSTVSELYNWTKDNAWRFGLVFRYSSAKQNITNHQGESSHLRYVGKVHAEYMYKYDLCLEEYLELLQKYNFNNPLSFISSDGNTYYLYHVTASQSGDTSIPIRKDTDTESYGAYEISGTNCGGFIVLQPYTTK